MSLQDPLGDIPDLHFLVWNERPCAPREFHNWMMKQHRVENLLHALAVLLLLHTITVLVQARKLISIPRGRDSFSHGVGERWIKLGVVPALNALTFNPYALQANILRNVL